MKGCRLRTRADWIQLVAEPHMLAAYQAFKPLLDREDRPTAVVCARDVFAHGACQAASEAGLQVGRDISVVGYDDISWGSAKRALTTFHEPCREMGAAAADMIVQRLLTGRTDMETQILPFPLIVRQSAGPPPDAKFPV